MPRTAGLARGLWALIVTLAVGLTLSSTTVDSGWAQAQRFLTLADLEIELERAISQAKLISDRPPYFIIQKVALKLAGKNSTAADGSIGFTIPIFDYGANLGIDLTQTDGGTLELELITPTREVVGGTTSIDLSSLVTILKDSFKPGTKFRVKSAKYTLLWTLQSDGGGKVNALVAKGGVHLAKENSQEITFYLCETLNRFECVN